MATHSSILAWSIPGTGKPDGLPSIRQHRVRHDQSNLAAAAKTGVLVPNLLQLTGCMLHAKSHQLCLTLCDPMDCSPPGSAVRGIFYKFRQICSPLWSSVLSSINDTVKLGEFQGPSQINSLSPSKTRRIMDMCPKKVFSCSFSFQFQFSFIFQTKF